MKLVPPCPSPRSVLLGATAALLTASSAMAAVGQVEPDRLYPDERAERIATAAQAQLDLSPAWQDFLARHGGEWQALWDEATGTPTRFWGTGWDVDPAALASDEAVFRLGTSILAQEADLHGVPLADLTPLVVDRRQGITTVSYARTWRGLPVVNSRVSLRFKHGRFVMGQFESMPSIDDTLRVHEPALDSKDATDRALAEMGWSQATTEHRGAELVVLPIATASSVQYRLAWQLELAATTFPSRRFTYVDARSGEVLSWREQIKFLDATVEVEHDNRWPENGLTQSALQFAEVDVNGQTVSADLWGGITVDGPGTATWTAGSRYFDVITADGEPLATFTAEIAADGDVLLGQLDADELGDVKYRRELAQLGTHVAAHNARQRALRINPNFGWASVEVLATVNSNETTCNAWFDGDISFVRQGDGCNNTGRVLDVVAHEYGHGFHGYSIIQGVGAFDGALSEGLSDYLAATLSGDPATARGFFLGSDQPLRDIELNRVWPEDVSEIHQTGRIIAGALWDVRKELVTLMGETDGVDHTDQLMWAAASRATDIPTSYAEVILADDDNGNLADGTPNGCIIDDQFGIHGLGPAAGELGLFTIDHDPALLAEPGVDIAVSARVELARPQCTTGDVGEVRLSWSVDGGDVQTVAMDGDLDYSVNLPAAEAGSEIRYWIEVFEAGGGLVGLMPQGSITDPYYAVFVGGGEVVFDADFEDDDGGFRSELLEGDQDSLGANDWQWGRPGGNSGDPSEAFSGDNVWGNDISPEENWNGAYQRNVHNALRSPSIAVGDDNRAVYLQFRRWLTVEDGFWDQAFVTVNGTTIWSQYEGPSENDSSNHHEDLHWALRTYDVTDLVEDGQIEVSWELIADAGLQLGGWNIDDVRVITFAADDGLVDGDLEGEGCGCSATGDDGGWAGLLLLPLLGLVRRRRA